MQENNIPFDPSRHDLLKSASKNHTMLLADDKVLVFYNLFRNKKQDKYFVYVKEKKVTMAREAVTPRSARLRRNPTEIVRPSLDVDAEAETIPVPRKLQRVQESELQLGLGTSALAQIRQQVPPGNRFIPRDENTQEGNIIGQGEVQVREIVQRGFNRISNRDVSTNMQTCLIIFWNRLYAQFTRCSKFGGNSDG